jgi:hypothetical protein
MVADVGTLPLSFAAVTVADRVPSKKCTFGFLPPRDPLGLDEISELYVSTLTSGMHEGETFPASRCGLSSKADSQVLFDDFRVSRADEPRR